LDASNAFKVGRMTWVKPSFYWCMSFIVGPNFLTDRPFICINRHVSIRLELQGSRASAHSSNHHVERRFFGIDRRGLFVY